MSLLWKSAVETFDICSCGCGCEPDGDWHWSQQPWCPCISQGCPCVTDQRLSREASQHPKEESVQHILNNYCFDDAWPEFQNEPGRRAWESVKKNFAPHPVHDQMRQDIRENGIQKPIGIDYDESPPRVRNGHTRLWHAEALGLDTVPVKHLDAWDAHDDILEDKR